MNENIKSSQNSNEGIGKIQARRRLIRGVFAAPAVLTVATGSAMATTSPAACAARLTGVAVGPNDNYFRVQQYTAQTALGPMKVVKAQDIKNRVGLMPISTTTFCGTKTWIRVSDGAGITAISTASDGVNSFVALRFVNDGSDVAPAYRVSGLSTGATTGAGTGNPLTASCWSSFA